MKRKIRESIYECAVVASIGLLFTIPVSLAMFTLDAPNDNSLLGADIWYAEEIERNDDKDEENDISEVSAVVHEPEEEFIDVSIEELIREACVHYDVPYDICLAIARLETGWFTSDAYIYGNNPGGMSINEVPIKYDNIALGVEAFVKNLANNYFAIGLDTPEKIGEKYCPINPAWGSTVRQIMEMEKD